MRPPHHHITGVRNDGGLLRELPGAQADAGAAASPAVAARRRREVVDGANRAHEQGDLPSVASAHVRAELRLPHVPVPHDGVTARPQHTGRKVSGGGGVVCIWLTRARCV